MKTLEKTGPQLTSRIKGDWIGLYRLVFSYLPLCISFLPSCTVSFENRTILMGIDPSS